MLGISILSLIIIILTMSRGGWLAISGAGAVYILMYIKKLKKESLFIIISVVIVLLLSVDLDYFFQQGKITD